MERRTWSFNAEDVVLSARAGNKAMIDIELWIHTPDNKSLSRLAQLVERVTSNDEVSRSSRLMGTSFSSFSFPKYDGQKW